MGEKLRRQRDPVGPTPAVVARDKVPNNRGHHAVGDAVGKVRRPVAHTLASATNARASSIGGAAQQRNSGGFSHGTDNLTPARAAKQTAGHEAGNQARAARTPVNAGERPRTSRLIDRLDIAMQQARVSGPQLAAHLGIKPQSFTNLRRKANGGMRTELVAHAAEFLRCDLHWLSTGEGGDYVAAVDLRQRVASAFADMLLTFNYDQVLDAFVAVNTWRQGSWPTFTAEPARAGKSRPTRAPTA
jgi:hypothetical protein